jgi:hypothetical protein
VRNKSWILSWSSIDDQETGLWIRPVDLSPGPMLSRLSLLRAHRRVLRQAQKHETQPRRREHLSLILELTDRQVAIEQARSTFRLSELLPLPKRLRDEEIGDAMEVINKIAADQTCPNRGRKIVLKLITAYFWLLVNSAREVFGAFRGKKSS